MQTTIKGAKWGWIRWHLEVSNTVLYNRKFWQKENMMSPHFIHLVSRSQAPKGGKHRVKK